MGQGEDQNYNGEEDRNGAENSPNEPAGMNQDYRAQEGGEEEGTGDDQTGEEEDEEGEEGDSSEAGQAQQQQQHQGDAPPFDPSKVRVKQEVEEQEEEDGGEEDEDDEENDDEDYETDPNRVPRVKTEVDHEQYQGWQEEEEEEPVDPEDHEALWEQDEDPDFDVDRVIRKRKATRRSRSHKSYYEDDEEDDEDDDDDEEDFKPPRRKGRGRPRGRGRGGRGRPRGSRDTYKRRPPPEPVPGEEVQCEKCEKMWPSLPSMLKHISHIKPCRKHYGEERIEEMRAEQRRARYRNKDPAKAEHDRQMRMRNYYENRLEKLQKSREYYQKNKDRITLEKRLRLRAEAEAQGKDVKDSKGVGASRTIRVMFPEPEAPKGTVRFDRGGGERLEGPCDFAEEDEETTSKLDPEMVGEEIPCMPDEYSLLARLAHTRELDFAVGFVGMTVGEGGEFLEARPLMARHDVNLRDLRELFHAVLAVTGATMGEMLNDKGSAITLVSYTRNLAGLRNKYSKEITDNDNREPEPPPTVCSPGRSREGQFLSPNMEAEVPGRQIMVNFGLEPVDMGAVAIECRVPKSEDRDIRGNRLVPLFTVNMEDWRLTVRLFFTLLVNWVGTRDLLEELWLATPCGAQGENEIHHEIKMECHHNCLQPKTVSVCEHCGKTFVYNAFIQSEKAKYDKHVAIHNTTCRICGKVFPNMPAKRNHQRTHRKEHYPCTAKKGCKYVGTTKEMLEKHIQYFHTRIVCELCGKDYTSKNSLALHISLTHNKQVDPSLVCSFCGKTGFHHDYELRRHEKRHTKPNSNVNRWMENKTTGFVCPLTHDNCKRYFKKASYVRKHIRLFAHEDPNWQGKELPTNLRKKGGKSKAAGSGKKRSSKKADAAAAAAAAAAAQEQQEEKPVKQAPPPPPAPVHKLNLPPGAAPAPHQMVQAAAAMAGVVPAGMEAALAAAQGYFPGMAAMHHPHHHQQHQQQLPHLHPQHQHLMEDGSSQGSYKQEYDGYDRT